MTILSSSCYLILFLITTYLLSRQRKSRNSDLIESNKTYRKKNSFGSEGKDLIKEENEGSEFVIENSQ